MKNGAIDFCHSFNILVISKKWSHHNILGLIYCTYYFNLILSIIYQISAWHGDFFMDSIIITDL
jgi:hypothetical protein